MSERFDILILGSGIGGLSFALQAASRGLRVAVLTKKTSVESNTNYAQGGIACVTGEGDDFESHVQDTLQAGDGLCREDVVREIVRDGPARVRELVELGLKFSRDETGAYDLGREGGHSRRRILHVKDTTGKAIEEALLQGVARSDKIELYEHLLAVDVLTEEKVLRRRLPLAENRVVGLYALNVNEGRVETFRAPAVVLATGGVGQVYQYTTNPAIATGDGVAMAYRAGVPIRNMEFIQFHPTTLYSVRGDRFLISEAVRGEGAILRNFAGEAFMTRYHPMADLAPRDVVARAIDAEMKQSGAPHVWLDITHREREFTRERFPQIFETCLRLGIDLGKDYIPVVPAAHYACGGVVTNLSAETGLAGLYACGEVACTGLHGANRLASNSLLEAVVMAHRGAEAVAEFLQRERPEPPSIPDWVDLGVHNADERVIISHNWDELRRTMWDYVGIVRSSKRLERARTRISNLAKEIHEYYWNFSIDPRLVELRNMIQVAELIIECALQRRESRGLHYTIDYPDQLAEAWDSEVRRRY